MILVPGYGGSTSGLDVLVARAVLDAIASLRSEKRTIVLSTHILPEVERLCERGRLRASAWLDVAGPRVGKSSTADLAALFSAPRSHAGGVEQ